MKTKIYVILFSLLVLFSCASNKNLNTFEKNNPQKADESIKTETVESNTDSNDNLTTPTDEVTTPVETTETETPMNANNSYSVTLPKNNYDERISIKERTDYRTYINNKYSGLTYRETESYLVQQTMSDAPVYNYKGEAFVIQDRRRNMKSNVKKLDGVFDIEFNYAPNSEYAMEHIYQPQEYVTDNGFPLLRNFPVLPDVKFTYDDIGKVWTGYSTIIVRPTTELPYITIPILAEYKYEGTTQYLNQTVHKITAQYSVRSNGDNNGLAKSYGSRSADIFLTMDTQVPVFIRERTEEEFIYTNGNKIKNSGTLLHFYKYEKNGEKYAQNKDSEPPTIPTSKDYDVTKTLRGIQLNLKDLKFKANESILLAGEELKLSKIANILKQYPTHKFFVEGHTADIGQAKNQKTLSENRALTIVNELVKLGVPEIQFLYSGAGGTKPIAPNNSESNRAKNRRVEITIMQ